MESFYFIDGEIFPVKGSIVVCFVLLITVVWLWVRKKKAEEIPGCDKEWFGEGPKRHESDTSVRKFEIQVPEGVLTDLQNRLENARTHRSLEGTNFEYGFNSAYLQKVVGHWRFQYQWRKEEEKLNSYPHFKTRIEGLDVHFVHVKPVGKKVVPILLTHGWPGSFMEFYKVIPLLTSEKPGHDFVFEVMCPSIPGFGFSDAPRQKGFNARAAARIFVTLMSRLGHSKFYVQGGDWGSVISTLMSKCYPDRVKGLHLNFVPLKPSLWNIFQCGRLYLFPSLVSPVEYSSLFPLRKRIGNFLLEGGYFLMNSTKPDTLASGLADSPVGLAAYILEKFSAWTNLNNKHLPDGGLTDTFNLDELLTHVMIYWINNNIDSSMRFYKEYFSDPNTAKYDSQPVLAPCGIAQFPNDFVTPRAMISKKEMRRLLSFRIMPRGGHFAAWEEPQLFSGDIWKFVNLVEKEY